MIEKTVDGYITGLEVSKAIKRTQSRKIIDDLGEDKW